MADLKAAAGRTALAALLVHALACSSGDDDHAAQPGPDRSEQLASCDTSPPDDADTGDPVRIVFTHTESGTRATELGRLVEEFTAANPDVEVLVEAWSGGVGALLDRWRDRDPEERSALSLMPKQYMGLLADSGQTVAPGDCLLQADTNLLPQVEGAWSLDGVLQAVPFAVSTPVLYYNRYLFREAGLDPGAPPETLDEILDMAPTLMEQGPSDRALVFDTGVEGSSSWYVEQTLAKAGLPSLLPANGRDPDHPAARVNWREEPVVDALTWLQTMHREGRTAWVQRNSDGQRDLVRAASPGRLVPLLVHTSASLGELSDILDGVATTAETVDLDHIDLAVAPMPGPGPGSLVGGDALWLSAGHSERETQAAWRLASWLASPEMHARWAAATGYVPISEAAATQPVVQDEWRAHPQTRVAYDVISSQPTTPEALGPVAGPLPDLHAILADAVEDIVIDGADPADTLDQAADEAESLLAAYNGSQPGG
jgi:sn-glycerol 3-phosphate transport system substrate-binding protein